MADDDLERQLETASPKVPPGTMGGAFRLTGGRGARHGGGMSKPEKQEVADKRPRGGAVLRLSAVKHSPRFIVSAVQRRPETVFCFYVDSSNVLHETVIALADVGVVFVVEKESGE